MLVHRCAEKFCNRMISRNKRYCDEHEPLHQFKPAYSNRYEKRKANAKYNKNKRDKEANAFYHSRRWQQVRNYIFNRDMSMCQICGNVTQNRKIVDHVIRREMCLNPLEINNLWTLCYTCHNIKTKAEETIIKNGDAEKLKSLNKSKWEKYVNEIRKRENE